MGKKLRTPYLGQLGIEIRALVIKLDFIIIKTLDFFEILFTNITPPISSSKFVFQDNFVSTTADFLVQKFF